MVETDEITVEKTIEEIIIDIINDIFEKNNIINSFLEEYGKLTKDHCTIAKKINKIKNILYISELEFEYEEYKKIINDKLKNILSSEDAIIQNINQNGVEASMTFINQKNSSIKVELKEIEKIIMHIFDYSILSAEKIDIRNLIKKYKQQLSSAIQDIKVKTQKIFNEFDNKNTEINEKQKNNELKNKEIASQMSELETSISNKISQYEREFSDLKKTAEDRFAKLQSDVEAKDEEISKLIGLVGNKANIGEYMKYADKAYKERIIWQIATLSIFIIAFVALMVITFRTKDYNMGTLIKYVITIILFGMSGYTAKQAGNLRKDEVYFRKQQLELSSIDVYLADMPDSIKQNIKVDLSSKIFGQARETYKNKYDDTANTTIDKISKMLENILNTINKN